MKILENIGLAPFTTFKIGGPAKYFCEVKDQFDALTAFEFAKERQLQTFVLGGGSNILVSDEGFNGLVIKIVNRGIEIANEHETTISLKVASGEIWDQVVRFAVKNNWWGIENLSHIPGSTGAIAVQNVGAYGQEAKNVIESVTAFNVNTHQIVSLPARDCRFAYRQSIFNSSQKGHYIIFEIVFRLSKTPKPNLSYHDLQGKFKGAEPSLSEIREAVIGIRNKKYPFPQEAKNGNAGSFFKNILADTEVYESLENSIATGFGNEVLENFRLKIHLEAGIFKIPTAFLLEICGLKGFSFGGAKINPNQPLIILNYTGKAKADDVLTLVQNIKKILFEKLGINLQIEPELVGFSQEKLRAIMSI